ncbi:hypothetical protein [Dongshaea marina]|uniref:hypothetical protein n=1 Tax=Dongshaea marina TaxID=2047966 RepID=UPI00131F288E|nr:hypothetical protein [Dongshaea marina]
MENIFHVAVMEQEIISIYGDEALELEALSMPELMAFSAKHGFSRPAPGQNKKRFAAMLNTCMRAGIEFKDQRVKQLILIVAEILQSLPDALSWYQLRPIPALGDRTARQLVALGRISELIGYIKTGLCGLCASASQTPATAKSVSCMKERGPESQPGCHQPVLAFAASQ